MKRILANRFTLIVAFRSICIVTFLTLAHTVSAQQIGYVADISGDWFLNGTTKLSWLSPLPAEGSISTNAPSEKSSYIVVVNHENKHLASKRCQNSGECNNPITLPKVAKKSLTQSLIDGICALVCPDPPKYAKVGGRGRGLNESVVKLTGDQLELKSVFKSLEEDEYFVAFEPLFANSEGPAKGVGPVPFNWDPDNPRPLAVTGLTKGLYRVRLLHKENANYQETGMDGWILVTDSSRYDDLHDRFAEALKLTKDWGKNVRPDRVNSFLRAALDLLSK